MTIIKAMIVILNLNIGCLGGNGISQTEMSYDTPAGTVHAIQYGNVIEGEMVIDGETKREIIEYKWDEERGEILPTSIYKSLLPLERV